MFRGLGQELVKGEAVTVKEDIVLFWGKHKVGGVAIAIYLTILLCFAVWFLLKKTRFGVYVYALGGNKNAAKLSGINTDRITIGVYVIGGLMCAISGIVSVGRMGATYIGLGESYELLAITACAIGGISLAGGEGNIWGAVIGGLFAQVIKNAMNLLEFEIYDQVIINGFVILVAVSIDYIRRRIKAKRNGSYEKG